jgi:hypothetical protein
VSLVRGKAAPDSERLAGSEGVFETVGNDWAVCTELTCDCHRLATYEGVWDILREVNLWEPLAGYVSSTVDGQQELAKWVSLVQHKVESRRLTNE